MISYILLLLLLFIALNVPTMYYFPGSPTLYILPFAYFYIIYKRRVSQYFYLFRRELVILFALCFYSFILDNISNNDVYFQNILYYVIDIFPISFFLVLLYSTISSKWQLIGERTFLNSIIFVSFLSGIVSMFLFFHPEVNSTVRTEILRTPDKAIFYINRSFGFASDLLFSFPIMQGLIGAICILLSKINKLYILLFVPIVLSVFFNARTGFIPIVLCLIFLLFRFKQYRHIYFYILSAIFLFIIIISYLNLSDLFSETLEWVLSSVYAVSNKFFGTDFAESANTFDVLETMLVYPRNLFFGDQRYYFGADINASDIGYILQLNYGGLMLIFLFFLFWCVIFFNLCKYSYSTFENNLFVLIMLITLLLSNYKGDFLVPSCAQRFIILFYVWRRMSVLNGKCY